MTQSESKPKPSGLVSTQTKLIFLASIAVLALLGGLLSGSYAAALMFLVIGFFAYRGLSQGLSGGIATIIALILAALLSPLLGGVLTPLLSSAFGITGLVGRGLGLGLGGMIVFAVAAGVLRVVIRRALKDRQLIKRADAAVGAIIGAGVGTLVAFVGAWVILALAPQTQPVALAPTPAPASTPDAPDAEEVEAPTPNPALEAITAFANDLRGSSIGAAAQATLPGDESKILTLASDFAYVARDPVARQHLVDSEVLKEIQNLPAAKQAAEKAKADPELRHIIEQGSLSPSDINLIAQSKTITDIIDTTDFVKQVTPLLPRLEEAIREAKASVTRPPN
ncbi:MAG: hypothetical protein WC718_04510 [Phycisphaerales bacterium]